MINYNSVLCRVFSITGSYENVFGIRDRTMATLLKENYSEQDIFNKTSHPDSPRRNMVRTDLQSPLSLLLLLRTYSRSGTPGASIYVSGESKKDLQDTGLRI